MFARTQSDSTWLGAGYVPGAADWQDLNTKIFRAVNGVRGGTWAPKSKIVFPDGGFEVTAPLLIAHGGELEIGRLELDGTNIWPQFAPGHELRKRTILNSLIAIRANGRHWRVTTDASIQTAAIGFLKIGGSQIVKPERGSMELEVHDRAKLTSAVFTFRVPVQRRLAPFGMPKFRIVQVDRDGRWKPLASPAVGADAEGWQSPPQVKSSVAWFDSGRAKTFTYVCDQNNVIDVSQYTYHVEIIEEDVDPNARIAVAVPMSTDAMSVRELRDDVDFATTRTLSVSSLAGNLTIDGGEATIPGQRILIMHGINNNEAGTRYLNGIWIAKAGAWTRASDFATSPVGGAYVADKVQRPFFVYVRKGVENRGKAFALAPPFPTTISDVSSEGGTADIYFEPSVDVGNKYHSVTLNFDNITEMRWQ